VAAWHCVTDGSVRAVVAVVLEEVLQNDREQLRGRLLNPGKKA
jgi:hypothetical protein